jgi:hypothetical protein
MLNDAKYIGLDVHQATISVVVLDGTGHLVMESVIETKAATILDPASFDFCLIGSDTFRADMLHLHGDVLHHCGHSGRKALISQVRWERAGQGLAGGDVELGAVHAASDERTGTMPTPPPEAIDADATLLFIVVPIVPPSMNTAAAPVETTATSPAGPAPTELPKTGSSLPLVGLFGGIFLSLALGPRAKRAQAFNQDHDR